MACRLVEVKPNQCWNINWTLGNKLQWNSNRNQYISIQEYAFENVCKMASFSSWPQWIKSSNIIVQERPWWRFVCYRLVLVNTLGWRHNGRDNVSNHQPHDCLLNRLFRRRSKKKSKLRVTGLCVGKSPGTGEFPAQMASNAENVSIWWRHHALWCWCPGTMWVPGEQQPFCPTR